MEPHHRPDRNVLLYGPDARAVRALDSAASHLLAEVGSYFPRWLEQGQHPVHDRLRRRGSALRPRLAWCMHARDAGWPAFSRMMRFLRVIIQLTANFVLRQLY